MNNYQSSLGLEKSGPWKEGKELQGGAEGERSGDKRQRENWL